MNNLEESINKKWYEKKENYLIIFGFIIVTIAVSTPFAIMYFNKYEFNLVKFSELGTVGDFFGGTTVGLLSLASLIFVTAAMFMQKEELELQRKEVTATRKEYEVTNKTMKKQSFDSVFFNLINLHHNILNDLSIDSREGKLEIKKMNNEFKMNYRVNSVHEWCNYFFSEICVSDEDIKEFIKIQKDLLNINPIIVENVPTKEGIKNIDLTHLNSDALNELEKMLLETERSQRTKLFSYQEPIKNKTIDTLLDLKNTKYSVDYEAVLKRPNKQVRDYCYNKYFKEKGHILSHYFNNIYIILKGILDFEFSKDTLENEREKQYYLEILKAQLTLEELEIIYYHVNYYERALKVKNILKNTDFFTELLIMKKLKWGMLDLEELKYYIK